MGRQHNEDKVEQKKMEVRANRWYNRLLNRHQNDPVSHMLIRWTCGEKRGMSLVIINPLSLSLFATRSLCWWRGVGISFVSVPTLEQLWRALPGSLTQQVRTDMQLWLHPYWANLNLESGLIVMTSMVLGRFCIQFVHVVDKNTFWLVSDLACRRRSWSCKETPPLVSHRSSPPSL